jgi:hypothetical protein
MSKQSLHTFTLHTPHLYVLDKYPLQSLTGQGMINFLIY